MPKRGKGSHAIYQYPGTTIRLTYSTPYKCVDSLSITA
ncbi:MAG: hypothetical protein MK111_23425 [Crocosphaera sp.]|nr:hypothetical protein [Crocosphaera sp.]